VFDAAIDVINQDCFWPSEHRVPARDAALPWHCQDIATHIGNIVKDRGVSFHQATNDKPILNSQHNFYNLI
jgi:hypothetical protein